MLGMGGVGTGLGARRRSRFDTLSWSCRIRDEVRVHKEDSDIHERFDPLPRRQTGMRDQSVTWPTHSPKVALHKKPLAASVSPTSFSHIHPLIHPPNQLNHSPLPPSSPTTFPQPQRRYPVNTPTILPTPSNPLSQTKQHSQKRKENKGS